MVFDGNYIQHGHPVQVVCAVAYAFRAILICCGGWCKIEFAASVHTVIANHRAIYIGSRSYAPNHLSGFPLAAAHFQGESILGRLTFQKRAGKSDQKQED